MLRCLFFLRLNFFFELCPNICRCKNKRKIIKGKKKCSKREKKNDFQLFWYQAVILHTHIFKCVIKGVYTHSTCTQTSKQFSWHSNRDAVLQWAIFVHASKYGPRENGSIVSQTTLIFFSR